MKRIGNFFLLLSLTCQSGIAQSFTLEYQGITLPADTVLVRAGTTDSLELTTYLTIRNDASTEKLIQAKKEEVSMLPGAAASLCWAGYCYPKEIFQTEFPLALGPGAVETSCFAHYLTNGDPGTSIVRWTYCDQENPADSVSVVIHYTTYPLGTGEPPSGIRTIAWPNPADGEVRVQAEGSDESEFIATLYTLDGKAVIQQRKTGPGNILVLDTSTLPSGVYILSTASGASPAGSGRLVVLHP